MTYSATAVMVVIQLLSAQHCNYKLAGVASQSVTFVHLIANITTITELTGLHRF